MIRKTATKYCKRAEQFHICFILRYAGFWRIYELTVRSLEQLLDLNVCRYIH